MHPPNKQKKNRKTDKANSRENRTPTSGGRNHGTCKNSNNWHLKRLKC